MRVWIDPTDSRSSYLTPVASLQLVLLAAAAFFGIRICRKVATTGSPFVQPVITALKVVGGILLIAGLL